MDFKRPPDSDPQQPCSSSETCRSLRQVGSKEVRSHEEIIGRCFGARRGRRCSGLLAGMVQCDLFLIEKVKSNEALCTHGQRQGKGRTRGQSEGKEESHRRSAEGKRS